MKKLLLLASWYLAWSFISSMFSSKKWKDLKKEIENNPWWCKSVFLDNFVETHKNLLNSLKDELNSEKNQKLLKDKKEKIDAMIRDFKEEGQELLKELKKWWEKSLSGIKTRLEDIYKEKKEKFDSMKSSWTKKIKEIKDNIASK